MTQHQDSSFLVPLLGGKKYNKKSHILSYAANQTASVQYNYNIVMNYNGLSIFKTDFPLILERLLKGYLNHTTPEYKVSVACLLACLQRKCAETFPDMQPVNSDCWLSHPLLEGLIISLCHNFLFCGNASS